MPAGLCGTRSGPQRRPGQGKPETPAGPGPTAGGWGGRWRARPRPARLPRAPPRCRGARVGGDGRAEGPAGTKSGGGGAAPPRRPFGVPRPRGLTRGPHPAPVPDRRRQRRWGWRHGGRRAARPGCAGGPRPRPPGPRRPPRPAPPRTARRAAGGCPWPPRTGPLRSAAGGVQGQAATSGKVPLQSLRAETAPPAALNARLPPHQLGSQQRAENVLVSVNKERAVQQGAFCFPRSCCCCPLLPLHNGTVPSLLLPGHPSPGHAVKEPSWQHG